VTERRADGIATFEEVLAAEERLVCNLALAGNAFDSMMRFGILLHSGGYDAAVFSIPSVSEVIEHSDEPLPLGITFRESCDRIRCVFGNPCPSSRRDKYAHLKTVGLGLLKLVAGHPNFCETPDTHAPISVHVVPFNEEWRTSTAIALAQQMYDSRDFSAMPILADALQDAGCDSADILDHCRGAGPHVRGCWVVDLVLGKS
jgi:hypothetical protein